MPGFAGPVTFSYHPNLNITEILFSFVKSDTIVIAMGDVIPAFDAATSYHGLKTADIENSISYIVNHFL